MGPPKRTARPAAGAVRPAASTPAAARKVLRVGVMQRFYPSLPLERWTQDRGLRHFRPWSLARRLTAAGARAILITHDAPASIVAARPDEPSGPRPTESRHGVPWAEAHAVRQAVVAPPAGLRSPVIYGPTDHNDYVVESMGCGAAFLDYDNDGWQDIVLLTGRRLQATPPGAIIRLYRNNRDGTFADVTEKSGLGRSVWATGITVADYDNDGYDDLIITCWGQNLLCHNNGDGTFTDVTAKAGLIHAGNRYGTGCTWIDYDRDGKLDLFVCHYVVFDQEKIPVRGKDPGCSCLGVPVYCGPAALPKESCRLYPNNGDGTMTDVSRESGIAAVK